MFILLNGSFGIGKTTVARRLVESLPGAVIYDPEAPGFVLRRLPAWMLGLKKQPDDYQDLALWRSLIAPGARRAGRRAAIVVVPMAFTNRAHFDAFAAALSEDGPVHRICLIASLETIQRRLQARARQEGSEVSAFQVRRSAECVKAHGHPAFGTPVDAEQTPAAIVAAIRQIVGIQG